MIRGSLMYETTNHESPTTKSASLQHKPPPNSPQPSHQKHRIRRQTCLDYYKNGTTVKTVGSNKNPDVMLKLALHFQNARQVSRFSA